MLKFDLTCCSVVSFAMQQNHVPIIRKILLKIKYTKLKAIRMSGTLTVDGTMGMKMIIGSSLEGLAINKFDYRLCTKKDIDLAIEYLKRAKLRGEKLLETLSNI